MKYFEVKFVISPFSDDVADIVAAVAGEAGFESFYTVNNQLIGYVQQSLFDDALLNQLLDSCSLPSVSYTIAEAEDRDWNEQWELEGFDPIIVDERLIIHDGRHLPDAPTSSHTTLAHSPHSTYISIEIDAHLAFGTGTHETTRMMCRSLLDLLVPTFPCTKSPSFLRVLDCGTGTGILAITALKLGVREAVGYDIDEWSVDNARHNAIINGVNDHFTALLGNASILDKVKGHFDVITANINRNILLSDMPVFVSKMSPGATLLLSGFYTEDAELVKEKARELNLKYVNLKQDHNWACLQFSYPNTPETRTTENE